ncbi:hypothetical protein [Phenylobacterium sp.]|nr:hypothetical protein [Phenylobacterium sp.]
MLASALAGGWRNARRFAREFERTAREGVARVNNPETWAGRRRAF